MQPLPQPPGNLLTRILAFILSAALLVAGLMFSLVFLAIAAVAGLALGGWFWWKTRALRRNMQTFNDDLQRATSTPDNGAIIEGEFAREADKTPNGDTALRRLP